MKNIKAFIVLATIINTALFAQTQSDSVRIKKNELGINVLPFFNAFNEAQSDNSPLLHIFYKRQLKGKWYGRLAISALSNLGNNMNEQSQINGFSNSKVAVEYNLIKKNTYLQYHLGIEKRWGGRKVTQFAGLDLGYANYNVSEKKYYGLRDSVDFYGQYSNYNYNNASNNTDSLIFKSKSSSNVAIINPFYGLQFHFSKRWFISAQVGLDLRFTSRLTKYSVDNRFLKNDYGAISNFDLNLKGIVNNISLCYKF